MSDLSIQRDMKRHLAEKEFDAMLRRYVLDLKHFQFGGPLNLISTIRTLFEQLAEEMECSDYATVAKKLLAVELEADLPYWSPKEAA